MSVEIKIKGTDKVKLNLKRWVEEKSGEAKKVLKEIGYRILTDAKLTAREKGVYETGLLIGSLSVNWTGGPQRGKVTPPAKSEHGIGRPDSKPDKFEVVVGTNVFYAPFQEFGTRKMAGRPYLFPSFFSHEGDVEKKIKEVIRK